MTDLSVVIACYLDAPHVYENSMRLANYFLATRLNVEFIFVEDCSPDHTRAEIERTVEELKKTSLATKTLFHQSNTGRGGAVMDGIRLASGNIVGFIDIDLEHLHDAILPMYLEMLDKNYDIVIGKRLMLYPGLYLSRSITSYVYRFLLRVFVKMPVTDSETGLKLFRRSKILPIINLCRDKHWFWDTEVLHRAHLDGLIIHEHTIVFCKNLEKQSTVKLFSDSYKHFVAMLKHSKAVKDEIRSRQPVH